MEGTSRIAYSDFQMKESDNKIQINNVLRVLSYIFIYSLFHTRIFTLSTQIFSITGLFLFPERL